MFISVHEFQLGATVVGRMVFNGRFKAIKTRQK